jgi:hypothetical protein
MLRALNWILWIFALLAIWGDAPGRWLHDPIGWKWVPVAGMLVSLFWPSRSRIAGRPTRNLPASQPLERTGGK